MPLYEYECERCGNRFERIQKFSDALVTECPTCEGPVRKLFSSPAIQFKGTGWYITDYARKPAGGGDEKSESRDKTDGKTEKKDGTTSKSDGKASGGSTDKGSSSGSSGSEK